VIGANVGYLGWGLEGGAFSLVSIGSRIATLGGGDVDV
jgi:hypothetical protein